MQSVYKELSETLEKEISILESKIQNQKFLLERASNNSPSLPEKGGIDPAYNSQVAASQQNRGYISGVQGGNSDAVVANPTIVSTDARLDSVKAAAKLAGIDKTGMFDFAAKPAKPILSNNFGLGMGLGMGDMEFSATRDFVNKYGGKEFQSDVNQVVDPEAISYLSWKAVNNAVAGKQNLDLKQNLEKYGLFDQDNYENNYPNAISPEYYSIDVASAFAKKLKKTEEKIAGNMTTKQKGFKVSKTLNRVKNK